MEKEKIEQSRTSISLILLSFLSLFSWLFFGPILSSLIYNTGKTILTSEYYYLLDYLALSAPYILLFLSILFVIRYFLKIPLKFFISQKTGSFNFIYYLKIGLVYFLVASLFTLFNYKNLIFDKSHFKYKAIILPFVLILTPLQATSEELFFRGIPFYLFSSLKEKTTFIKVILIFLSGLLFMLIHLFNIEVGNNTVPFFSLVYYFLWGSLAFSLTLYSESLSAVISMHTVNNLYIALIVNKENSSMLSKSLFIDTSLTYSNLASIFELLCFFSSIFALTYFLKKKEEKGKLNEKN